METTQTALKVMEQIERHTDVRGRFNWGMRDVFDEAPRIS
jgi:hypothetical protein